MIDEFKSLVWIPLNHHQICKVGYIRTKESNEGSWLWNAICFQLKTNYKWDRNKSLSGTFCCEITALRVWGNFQTLKFYKKHENIFI